MEPVTTTIAIVGLPLALWVLWTNEKTSKERIALIEARPWGDSYNKYAAQYSAVTYHQHFWHRLTFRDPFQLYGPETRKLVGK